MLRCPKCNRSYQDGAQRFCTRDGARLLDTENPLNQVERIPTGQLPRQTPPGELLVETFIVPPGYLSAGDTETPEESVAPLARSYEINPANPEFISDDKYEVRHYLFDSLPENKEEKREEERQKTSETVAATPRKVVKNQPKSKRKPKKTNVPFIAVCLLGGLLFLTAALFTSVYLFRQPRPLSVATVPHQETIPRENASAPKPNSGFLNRRPVAFRNERANLSGRLAEKFIGFSLEYPGDWKNEAQDGNGNNFLDIGNRVSTRVPIEQLLVSWYESKGTFEADRETFPKLAPKLNTIYNLPAYRQLSEGAVTINGLDAYEVRFEADAADVKGAAVKVWGRTIFIPVGKPEAKNGLLVTLLATSLAPSLSGAADVGEKGELAEILKTLKLEE